MLKCERCNHEWNQKDESKKPKTCPKCNSPFWEKELSPYWKAQKEKREAAKKDKKKGSGK